MKHLSKAESEGPKDAANAAGVTDWLGSWKGKDRQRKVRGQILMLLYTTKYRAVNPLVNQGYLNF